MNLYRRNGVESLSDMRQMYDAIPSYPQRPDPYLQFDQAPIYAIGGHKYDGTTEPSQKKRYNGQIVDLESYKELQRQLIRDAAVKRALTRTAGMPPINPAVVTADMPEYLKYGTGGNKITDWISKALGLKKQNAVQIKQQAVVGPSEEELNAKYQYVLGDHNILPTSIKGANGKTYKYDARTDQFDGDTYYDVVAARYSGIKKALQKKGLSNEAVERLARFLTVQNVYEGGWRVNKGADKWGGGVNNFGGMRNGRVGYISFDSPEEYYDKYVDNLDFYWGDERLGSGNGWRNAQTLDDYARIIQHRDLGLDTREKYDAYNRAHHDNPVFIYTPLWENNNTDLMHPAKFGGVNDRVNAYIDLYNQRNEIGNQEMINNGAVGRRYEFDRGGAMHTNTKKKSYGGVKF